MEIGIKATRHQSFALCFLNVQRQRLILKKCWVSNIRAAKLLLFWTWKDLQPLNMCLFDIVFEIGDSHGILKKKDTFSEQHHIREDVVVFRIFSLAGFEGLVFSNIRVLMVCFERWKDSQKRNI
jgi:hypothetical protein